jgi:GNAT superfamily N-acetyltransferase
MKFEELNVSKFTEEDTKIITKIAFDCWVELWPDKPINFDFDLLGKLVGTGLATMVAAKDDEGKILGLQVWEHYSTWLNKSRSVSSLRVIYIKPEYRETVSAARFLEWAKQLYITKGAGKITAVVDEEHPHVRELMKKCGFSKQIAQVFEV